MAKYDPDKRRRQPSRKKHITGYRADSLRHREARELVPPERRVEIARLGGEARAERFRAARQTKRKPPTSQAATAARPKPIASAVEAQIERVMREASGMTPEERKAERARRAAATRPARRAAAKARKLAEERAKGKR
jgi:hypothetical protein